MIIPNFFSLIFHKYCYNPHWGFKHVNTSLHPIVSKARKPSFRNRVIERGLGFQTLKTKFFTAHGQIHIIQSTNQKIRFVHNRTHCNRTRSSTIETQPENLRLDRGNKEISYQVYSKKELRVTVTGDQRPARET